MTAKTRDEVLESRWVGTFAVGVVLLVLAVIAMQGNGWGAPILLLVGGILFAYGLVRRMVDHRDLERRAETD